MKWRGTARLAWEFEALDRPTAVRHLGDLLDGIESGSEDDYQGHFDFRLSELHRPNRRSSPADPCTSPANLRSSRRPITSPWPARRQWPKE